MIFLKRRMLVKKEFLKKAIVLGGVFMLAAALKANAADISVRAVFDPLNGNLTVGGNSEENVVITVIKSGTEYSNLYDSQPDEFQYVSPEDGKYSYTFDFSNGELSKKYIVSATSYSGEASSTFICYSNEAAQEFFENNLKGKSEEEFCPVMEKNGGVFGFDYEDDIHVKYGSEIIRILYAFKNNSAEDIIKNYSVAKIYAQLGGADKSDVETLISKYAEELGLDFKADWADRINEQVKDDIVEAVVKCDYAEIASKKDKNFKKVLDDFFITALCQKAESWLAVRNLIIEDYYEIFADKLKSSKYTALKSKDAVFIDMMSYRSGFTSAASIADILDSSIKRQYDKESEEPKRTQGGGGGGSGSGSGKSSVSGLAGGSAAAPKPESTVKENTDTAQNFKDVSKTHWCAADIEKLSEKGIVSGYDDGTFRPEESVSRAEFVKLVISAFGGTADGEYDENFADVKKSDWFAPYIGTASSLGIINGDGEKFNPNSHITREDAAVIVYRIGAQKLAKGDKSDFTDGAEVADYAAEAVSALSLNGIINGFGNGMFMPKKEITRAESVSIICRLFEILK